MVNRSKSSLKTRLRTKQRHSNSLKRSRSKQKPSQSKPKRSPSKSKSSTKLVRYHVHDNGGRPFRVDVDKNRVHIYKSVMGDNLRDQYPTLTKTLPYDRLFVGKPRGNSLLLKQGGKYVYIGTSVKEFTPKADIVKYVSPIGSSDVPYPYAVDTKGNYYLLIENVILDYINGSNPYDYYYANKPKRTKLVSKTLLKGY